MAKRKIIDVNAIGERGEAIFFTRITTLHGLKPLFKPAFLGEKWAVADFVVELVNHPGRYFLVQVKATSKGNNATGQLKVAVSADRYAKLVSAWVPSYVVGVNDGTEDAYITAAAPRKTGLSSLKTQFSLKDAVVREQLFKEVADFWDVAKAAGRPWMSRLY